MAHQPLPNQPSATMQSEITNLVSRLRLLEERHANLQRKMHLVEEHLLNNSKETKKEIKIIQSELVEVKNSVKEFGEILDRLTRGLQDFATREDVKLIDRYVSLLDPTNFISRAHLEKEVKRQIESALLNKGIK
ncbi:MAG: hypothetical protein ACMXYL_03920 [Candidatus Woesearchaeota archaeon]